MRDFLNFLNDDEGYFYNSLENTIFYSNKYFVDSSKNLGNSRAYIKVTKSEREAYKEKEAKKQRKTINKNKR